MLISKKWLETYFQEELPSMQEISDILLLHAFEIEGLEEKDGDWILDVDVLPNRAHDCLCHEGIAKELAGLIEKKLFTERFSSYADAKKTQEKVSVQVKNPKQCLRYSARLIKNIEVRESPEWLKTRLKAMGQKSINAVVDATNFILFDMGQPTHVFDADKVAGSIVVRNAEVGEKMISLTGEEIELTPEDLVIADEEKILALAGVKGGKAAELTEDTKNIIIESANFDPVSVRKTARRTKILTDASKRYENGITSEKVFYAMEAITSLILELAGTTETEISPVTDVYPNPEAAFVLDLSLAHASRLLGFELTEEEVNAILERFHYSYLIRDGIYQIAIPHERLDLRIPEDMIEEIGRIYGYHKIPTKRLDTFHFSPEINKYFLLTQQLRNYFVSKGFTEIMNYTFVKKGDLELLNPLARDKKALRKNLTKQMKESLEKNARERDFLGEEQTLLFEIDRVHQGEKEIFYCVFGIDAGSKKSRKKYGTEKEQIERHKEALRKVFGKKLSFQEEGNIVSFSLEEIEVDGNYNQIFDLKTYGENSRFQGISPYPYIKRDVSFWIDDRKTKEELYSLIGNAGAQFLVKIFLFDEFEKDGRKSYAFSLIFQSFEKTLTDTEVEKEMEKIYTALRNVGAEIR